MIDYVIKEYRKGVEQDQARIGYKAAENWIWPYAYELDDILSIHARPDFDPETRHYCFLGEKMVGYMFSIVTTAASNGACQATLDFPRMLPGHEWAADLLMKTAIDTLKNKGVSNIVGKVTNMCPANIKLAEKFGFSIFDWGYKMYYSYEMVLT